MRSMRVGFDGHGLFQLLPEVSGLARSKTPQSTLSHQLSAQIGYISRIAAAARL